jgi:trans-aconitate methyltransferase
VSFEVPADAYFQFVGAYSEQLAAGFADLAGVHPGQRVIDVGCGPGALTAQLVERLGPDLVSAVDPSDSFVAEAGRRFPGVDVRSGRAEALPYPDASFDAALAQLVVHFMSDPVAGLSAAAGRSRRFGAPLATSTQASTMSLGSPALGRDTSTSCSLRPASTSSSRRT